MLVTDGYKQFEAILYAYARRDLPAASAKVHGLLSRDNETPSARDVRSSAGGHRRINTNTEGPTIINFTFADQDLK
jgi:hypothetical protein